MTTDDSSDGPRCERQTGESPDAETDSSSLTRQTVVGIGASADGLEALETFFEALAPQPETTFLVVQHLAPDAESNLPEILQKFTSLDVRVAADDDPLRPGRVYVIPPDRQLAVRDGRLAVDPLPDVDLERRTIDHLFRSIGREYGARSVGIVLSGASADGTEGLREIRARGGITMAQDPRQAGFPTMPRSAQQAGVVDFVLPAEEIGRQLYDLVVSGLRSGALAEEPELDPDQHDLVERILQSLREHSGHDFSEYKRPTLLRRIGRRMQVRRTDSLETYAEYLQSHSRERDTLFDEVTISVTEFFRDPDVWESLRDDAVPAIFDDKTPEDQVRAWVPACSTGEEAYTLAMLLSDYADELAHRPEIKTFATDINESAIDRAREGRYPPTAAADAPTELFERYFYHEEDHYRVGKALRRQLLFAVHNALSDPPFRNLDIVSCRNLLIYLQPPAQKRLLHLLHYGLRPGAYLLVGTSEGTGQAPELFDEVDAQRGLYLARGDAQSDVALDGAPFGFATASDPKPRTIDAPDPRTDTESLHRQVVVDNHAPPSILVDEDYQLLHTVGDLHPYLSVPSGEATEDVLEMVPEHVRPHLRGMLFETFQGEERVTRHFSTENGFDVGPVEVEANRVEAGLFHGPVVSVSFSRETTPPPDSDDHGADHASSTADDKDEVIDRLERELEQTRHRLETTIEEYEVSNEKLRASNEELLSMNEELQSTTEELETGREELQSMNEELTTVNDELNEKIEELDKLNSDLKNLLRSTDIGTIFLNRDLEIQRYTKSIEDYFNLRSGDVGRPLADITHDLQTDDLIDRVRTVLDEVTTVEDELKDKDGERHLLFRALPYLTVDDRVDGVVMTFVDITERKRIQNRLETSEIKFRTVFESAADAMFVYRVGPDGEPGPFDDVNSRAIELTGFDRGELRTMTVCDMLVGDDFDCTEHVDRVGRDVDELGEARLQRANGRDPIPCEFRSKRMAVDDKQFVVEVVRDLRERTRVDETLERERRRAEALAELRSVFLSTLTHDLQSPLADIAAAAHALRSELDGESERRAEEIDRATTRLRKILNRVLRRARVETNRALSHPGDFDLVEHIRELLALYESVAESLGKNLRYDGPDSPVDVRLDPHLVRQVLNNLVEAALRNADAETVTLQLADSDDEFRIVVSGISDAALRDAADEAVGRDTASIDSDLAVNEFLVRSMEGEMHIEHDDDRTPRAVVALPKRVEPRVDELDT